MKRSEDTKKRILFAAECEFAEKGLYGARVDEIAKAAGTNKRMLYAYFGNKEELYEKVLLNVYDLLARSEAELIEKDRNTEPSVAIKNIICLYFDFLKSNERFVRMLMWENLNNARYLKNTETSDIKKPVIMHIEQKIREGKENGSFSEKASAQRVNTALLTFVFSYFSNMNTLSLVLGRDLSDEAELSAHRDFVCELIIKYLK